MTSFMEVLSHLDLHIGIKSHRLDVEPHKREDRDDEHCTLGDVIGP
jgi:hypothetical protein